MRLVMALAALPLISLGIGGWWLAARAPARTDEASVASSAAAPRTPELERHRVKARGQLGPGRGTLLIGLEPPASSKLTEGGPLSVRGRGEHLTFPESIKRPLDPKRIPIRLPIDVADGATGPALLELSFYWCEGGIASACRPERVELEVDLDLTGDAPGGEAFVDYRVGQ